MPEQIPFQIVTRGARQRASEAEQEQAQARLRAALQNHAQAQTLIQAHVQAQAQAQNQSQAQAHPQTHAQAHAQAQALAQAQAQAQTQAHAQAQAQAQAQAHQAQAGDANNVPTVPVTASTPRRANSRRRGSDPAPSVARRTPRRRRAQTSATGQPESTSTRAGPSRQRGGIVRNPRTPRRPTRAGLQLANGRRDTDAGIVDTPQLTAQDMEGHNQLGRGPPILDNPLPAANEDTNDYQDQNQPELDQGQQGPQMNAVQPVGDLGTLNEFGLTNHEANPEFPLGDLSTLNEFGLTNHEANPEFPLDTRYLVPGNEAPDMMEWLEPNAVQPVGDLSTLNEFGLTNHEANPQFPLDARYLVPGNEAPGMMEWLEPDAPAQPILVERCTSPTCPVPNTIIHARGPYLHTVEPRMEIGVYPFGLSIPPPPVWDMAHRLNSGNEQPGDREAVESFTRNHSWNAAVYEDVNGELFMDP